MKPEKRRTGETRKREGIKGKEKKRKRRERRKKGGKVDRECSVRG